MSVKVANGLITVALVVVFAIIFYAVFFSGPPPH